MKLQRVRTVVNQRGRWVKIRAVTIKDLIDLRQFAYRFRGKNIYETLIPFFDTLTWRDKHNHSYSVLTVRCAIKVIRCLTDAIAKDLIYNNTIFLLPYNVAYLVVAQRSLTSKSYLDKIGMSHKNVALFLILTKRGIGWSNGRIMHAFFQDKWRYKLYDEISKGHIYENIDDIIPKMIDYVNQR